MTTTTETVDSTVYELISAADALVQNTSAYDVRIVFGTVLPDVDEAAFHPLAPREAILKSGGLPTGNIYARADLASRDCKLAISV